jgi:hypothetical protein
MSITYDVKVLADSISPDGVRLTTLQCRYPRFIHSEMLRHRVFSHSVASSRAIPTEKQIERVRENPFVPETFNKRVKGMGVGEALDPEAQQDARDAWLWAADHAAMIAEKLNAIGIDKSRANRLLEPFIWVDDIITATEWDNFFALRDHPAAQPEFQILAQIMRAALKTSEPRHVGYDSWHLPYVKDEEVKEDLVKANYDEQPWVFDSVMDVWKRVSASRCARVSFDTHEQIEPIHRSLERADMLINSGHLSPFEHVARPMGIPALGHLKPAAAFMGNFRGWVQFRKEFPNEENFGALVKKEVEV